MYIVENTYNIRILSLTTNILSSFNHYRVLLNERDPKTIDLNPTVVAQSHDESGYYFAETKALKFFKYSTSTVSHIAGFNYLSYSSTTSPVGSDHLGGTFADARFVSIASIVVEPSGNLYLLDNQLIKYLNKSSGLMKVVAGITSGSTCANNSTATSCSILNAKSLHVYQDEIYFATDVYVYKVNPTTGIIYKVLGGGSTTADGPASQASIQTIKGLYLRPSDRRIYYFQQVTVGVVSTYYLKVFDSNSQNVTTIFTETTAPSSNSIYVTDDGHVYYIINSYLKVFTPNYSNANSGTVSVYAGLGTSFNDASTLANTKFNSLRYFFFDRTMNYWSIAEYGELRKIYMNCDTNYGGPYCDVPYCHSFIGNDPIVCYSHGACVAIDTCLCENGYFGSNCNITSCYGILGNETQVCNSNGECINKDTCNCHGGYGGLQCEIPSCFGILANQTEIVCSGNGNCSALDTCNCYNASTSANCSLTQPSISTQNSSTNGTSNSNFTNVDNSTLLNNSTNLNSSIPSNVTSDVNSTVNNSSSVDNSTLSNNTSLVTNVTSNELNNTLLTNVTSDLNSTTINNSSTVENSTLGNNTEIVVNNNTQSNNQSISPTYPSNTTISYSCFGISSLETKIACSGHGECIGNELCKCLDGYYGVKCNISTCNSRRQDDASVCSSKGQCSSNGKCVCQLGYGGLDCEFKTCFGISSNDTKVCGGRGKCTDIDTCQCYSIGNVKIVGSQCEYLLCKGVYNGNEEYFSHNDQRVCSNHGKCSIDGIAMTGGCSCETGYYGNSCNQFDCNGISNTNSSVCSGKGQCSSPNTCSCFDDDTRGHYYGPSCNSCHPAFSGQLCNEQKCSTCLNGGLCGSNNSCICFGNFKGLICESCKENYFGSNCDIYCKAETNCNGHGSCNAINGQCTCFSDREHGFWNGSSCSSCMSGYYGQDCSTFIGSLNSNFTDQVYAQIDENFDGISLKIIPPLYYNRNTLPCSMIIHPDDMSLVGTMPKCYWTNKLTGDFKVQFDYDFNNGIANSVIRLNTNAFDKKRSILSNDSFIRVYLLMPSFVHSPIASIQSMKKSYSNDEEILFTGTNSYSGDKKELQYSWEIQGDSIPPSVSTFVKNSKIPTLKFDKNQLSKGIYKIILTVKSQVTSSSSDPEYFTFQVQDYQVPSAVISGTKDSIFKSTDKLVVVKKKTSIPSLLKDQSVIYEWEQIEGPSLKFKKDSYNNLVIENFSSGKSRYIFKVTITSSSNATLFSSDFVIISTEQPELSLSLSLKETSSNSPSIFVNYEDPEKNNNEKEIWMWTCFDSETGGYCGDSIVKKMDESSKAHSTIFSLYPFDDYFKLITKPKFTLTISKVDRSVSSSITLSILNYSPPKVRIISGISQKTIFNSQDRISMEVEHEKFMDSSISLKNSWLLDSSLISESLTSKSDISNTFTTMTTIEPSSNSIKVVNRNEYSAISVNANDLEEGTDHSINLKVSYIRKNDSSEISSTELIKNFKKALKPNRCPCSISPTSGVSLKTDFKFECENYQNGENTISISQGFIDRETGLKIGLTLSESKTVKIPVIPKSNNELVTLFVEITDIVTGESQIIYSNVTLSPPVSSPTTMTEILQQLSNQTNYITQTLLSDGDINQGISETLNTIISTSQHLQNLPPSEKDSNSITSLQTKTLETLDKVVETTKEETSIKQSTTSKIVFAIYSMIKNEEKIGATIIEKSVGVLDKLINQVSDSNLEVSAETAQTVVSIVDKLSESVSNISNVNEKFNKTEKLASLTEELAISIVKEQPMSADPVILKEVNAVVKVDKSYVTDLSNSLISSPEVKAGNSNTAKIYSKISIPAISSDSNQLEQVTYSTVVKENIPSLVNQIIDDNLEVVSPVSSGFSIVSSSNSSVIDWTKNVTIQIRVSDSDFALSNISSYSCYDIQPGNLFPDPSLCTLSGYDNATSTISCNCIFSDLFLANVIVIRNSSQGETLRIGGEVSYMSTQDIIILVSVICGSCLILFICFFVILICRFVIFKSYSKREMPEPVKPKELKTHTIMQPEKLTSRSGSSVTSPTTINSSLSINMIDY